MNHEFYMQRCLDLAASALADAAPNPSVGAILVHDNIIIAEGYTSPYGGPHGEVNCINKVKPEQLVLLAESTLYVSLEPCSHYGKTPPCSELIIKHKIPKVVIALSDSNPLVAGKGIEKLRNSGVDVLVGILENEAYELNKRFFTYHEKKRPYIILKWAQSKTGYFAPDNKEQFWITNQKTKMLVHAWRSQEMAILVGENTIISDNPRLNTRLISGKSPIRIVINTIEPLDKGSIIFQDGQATIVFSIFKEKDFEAVKFVMIQEDKGVLDQVLQKLFELGINSLIVEGGAFTLEQFIAENYWDEARILTGSSTLETGIKAPSIHGKLDDNYSLLDDDIKILRNDL